MSINFNEAKKLVTIYRSTHPVNTK